jgi:LytS/YehU family sensor histidine kinase
MLSLAIAWVFNFALFVLTTHFYRQIIRKKNIEAMRLYKFLLYPIVANVIILIIVQVFNSEVLDFDQIFWENYKGSFGNYFLQSLDTFRFVMPWFIFYHGIRFAELAIQNERDKLEAQMQLKIAELENLKSQLNPHFLFNALNSIRSLTLTDPIMARDATTKLSDLLRISLTYKDLQDIPFEEELNLVKDYLSLEKIRFEDRLNYSFEISKGILKALVPPMSLQLLAENAVKHGISKEKMGGEVIVYAHKQEGNLVFGIKNTGSLIKPISDKNKRQGIGLENLKRRLEINYGIKDGFKISELDKVVTSQVSIPLRIKKGKKELTV